ncbi:hypothetical protein D3C74_394870 [compost metagenome]
MTAPRTGRSYDVPARSSRLASTHPRRAATSSIVRYTNTPGSSLPGIGGRAASEPVASTSSS